LSKAFEINFDGIVGPTHNYAGLSFGNVASQAHGGSASHPREAALQGLAKMKFLHDLGIKQAVLPPQPRPDLATLRRLGFDGSDADALWRASRDEPRLLAAVYSSSAMWAANAATVSPSADCEDGCVHFTTAN
jgi:succinylarginine dihydrolase